MKKLFLIPVFCLMFSTMTHAQDYYRAAVGLRLGSDLGINAKYFLKHTAALEGIISLRWNGIMVTALYEFEYMAFDTPGLNWYIGGGAHLGSWTNYSGNIGWWNYETHPDGFIIGGADFIIGMEYTLQAIPLNFAVDWKPAINFIGMTNFWGDFFALTIRYAFI